MRRNLAWFGLVRVMRFGIGFECYVESPLKGRA